MIVNIPSPLYSYTRNKSVVDGRGATVAELVADLDLRFPGLRFRIIDEQDAIRPHIRIFVNERKVESLDTPLGARDEVHIICAISGGEN